MPSALAAEVDRRLGAVEAELTAAAGGASLCSISRSGGGSVPTVKYLEGRMAALLELRRTVRRTSDDGADPVAAARTEWTTALEDLRRRDAGPDWLAYRAGGVDELNELGPAREEGSTGH